MSHNQKPFEWVTPFFIGSRPNFRKTAMHRLPLESSEISSDAAPVMMGVQEGGGNADTLLTNSHALRANQPAPHLIYS